MKEQCIERVIDTLQAYLATELAKMNAPVAPTGMAVIADLAAPAASNYYVDRPPLGAMTGYPAILIRVTQSRVVGRQSSPNTGVLDIEHSAQIHVVCNDTEPGRLARRLWRTEQAVIHVMERYGYTDGASPNTGQMESTFLQQVDEGEAEPVETGGLVKASTITFALIERITATVATYE